MPFFSYRLTCYELGQFSHFNKPLETYASEIRKRIAGIGQGQTNDEEDEDYHYLPARGNETFTRTLESVSWTSREIRRDEYFEGTESTITVQYNDAVTYEIRIYSDVLSKSGSIAFSHGAPVVINSILTWMREAFDTVIELSAFPAHVVAACYELYMESQFAVYEESGLNPDLLYTEIQYGIAEVTAKPQNLKHTTVVLRGEDCLKFHKDGKFLYNVYNHLFQTTGIDFTKMKILSLRCKGFEMSSKGRIKWLDNENASKNSAWVFYAQLMNILRQSDEL